MSESDQRGKPPSEDQVRLALVSFAALIRRLDDDGKLLQGIPFLMRRIGDLRQVLFDYEVRSTERLLPIKDPGEREARRLLRELEERKREMMEEWEVGWTPPEGDDEER